jgi:hypothetical protein
MFLHFCEALSLLLFIALSIWVPLSLLIVIAISLSISVIVSFCYCFSIIMYLLFASPIPLSKKLKGDLKNCSQNSLLVHEICTFKTRYLIQSLWCLVLQHHSDNATLHFVLPLNALARRRSLLKLGAVIAS